MRQVPDIAKHPPKGRLIPASVDVAVVLAAVALMNEEKVEVPRSPLIVVEAVRPMYIPSSDEKEVDEADLNV